jgi:LPXTG-motif cell wall-anchored protein
MLFLIAGLFASSPIHAQPPAVIAATSTAAVQTAEAVYATDLARNPLPPSGTPFIPAPTASVAVAPTPANAPATQTVAAQTAEAGLLAVQTSVSGMTATPVPSLVSVTPPTPVPILLPNTGRESGSLWPLGVVLAAVLAIACGMALRWRRVPR